MSTAAARLRRFRERQATGRLMLKVDEVNLLDHCDMLTAAG